MIEEISDILPIVKLGHRGIQKKFGSTDLYQSIRILLESFTEYYEISASQCAESITEFNTQYLLDIANYEASKKYPHQLGQVQGLPRLSYDAILISSILFVKHRFRIAELIHEYCADREGEFLIVGGGSGVELALISPIAKAIDLYDPNMDKDFIASTFPDVKCYSKEFGSRSKSAAETILAIEILEHLENPQSLLEDIYSHLPHEGVLLCTIAVDCPQFDHLNNLNPLEFKEMVEAIGFAIEYEERITHVMSVSNVQPYNVFYKLQKA